MSEPYLPEPARGPFDAWLEACVARHSEGLLFAEIRKGVQALSSLYVERRAGSDLSARAIDGHGKRAALATYYAPLHFLAAWHAMHALLAALGPGWGSGVKTLWDLGCGTGATGAAIAGAIPESEPAQRPAVVGIDRSGWALGEARRTYGAFGLACKTRRGALPAAFRRAGAGELVALGWSLNELDDAGRDHMLERLVASLERGGRVVVLEPLATAAAPWWPAAAGALEPYGARAIEWRLPLERPQWIHELDRASGLDHRVLGARALAAGARD